MFGFVLRRLRGRLPLAAAVLFTVLIATTVLTTLVAFDRTVAEAGLRRNLDGGSRVGVLLGADHALDARAADDAEATALGTRLFDGLPVTTQTLARSRSYGLPGLPNAAREVDLTVLAALDRGRLRLTAGQWPTADGTAGGAGTAGTVQTAVPQSALSRLGLTATALPAQVTLSDRYGGPPLTVRITGVYQAVDRDAPYWRLDPLGGREIQVRGFTTYGPMLVDDGVFTSGLLPQGGRSALLTADFSGADPERVDRVRARAAQLPELLRQQSPGLQLQTDLPALLAELHSATLVTASGLLIGALQLAVLAGAALLLVVHLVTERQARENALLTARGATRGRLVAWTALEALLLALPAAVLAPLLTGPLLRLMTSYGPLTGLPLDQADTAVRWPVAALCALACVALTALPAVLRGGTRTVSRRQAVVSAAARSGADLTLLVLAVLAYQQLGARTGGLSVDADGQLGIDPVLVAAPTLALCAGTLLVLRLLPFASRLGARLAARGRGLGPALAGWQLARRPGRANGPVLLLVLAVATGVLALGQHAAWRDSQRDQADFASAGGLRIQGSALPPLGQGGRYAALPGGDRLLPVARVDQTLPGEKQARVLLTDTARAAAELTVRPDLFDDRSAAGLFAPLAGRQPAGLLLPGRPARIDLTVALDTAEAPAADPDAPFPSRTAQPPQPPDLWLQLRDGFGAAHRVLVPQLPTRGELTVSVDLGPLTAAPLGSVAAPLTLTGFGLTPATGQGTGGGELTIRRLAVADTASGAATPVPAPAGSWDAPAGSGSQVQVRSGSAGDLLTLGYTPGADRGDGGRAVVLVPGADRSGPEVEGLATRAYLTAAGAGVGDLVKIQIGNAAVPVRITGAVEALPVYGDTALLLDLAGTSRWLSDRGADAPVVSEWWLPATGPGDRTPAEAAAALRAGPTAQQLTLREEDAAARVRDPLSAAPQSALAALAAAAAVLAAIGFAAASAASAGERAGEWAVLVALGTPRRLLDRTAAAERLVLVGLGTGVGLLLGTVLVHLVVPLVVLTPAARPPVPEVLVGLPLGQVLALAAGTAALPLLSAFLVGGRRRNLAARLRSVEEK